MRIASFIAETSCVSYKCIAISEKSVPIFKVCVISGCTSASNIAAFDGKCLYKAPAVIPVIAAFFWKKANWQGACASMGLSFLTVIGTMIYFTPSSTIPILLGISVNLITLVVVSLLTKPNDVEKMQKWEERIS